MTNKEITQESFLRDVKDHELIIIKDSGIDRHIRLKAHDSMCAYFDLITWKGHLCYTGDMGSYLFSRTEDMFKFFRSDKENEIPNFNYWAEKVLASDKNSGIKEYSQEVFEQYIKEWRLDHVREMFSSNTGDKQLRRKFWETVQSEILNKEYEQEYSARQLIEDWNYYHKEDQYGDFWETDLMDWTYRYKWACWAIQWAIREYDKKKESL